MPWTKPTRYSVPSHKRASSGERPDSHLRVEVRMDGRPLMMQMGREHDGGTSTQNGKPDGSYDYTQDMGKDAWSWRLLTIAPFRQTG